MTAINQKQIKPVDVVDSAKDDDSVLHRYFEWDDTKASHEYRLWQARELIVTYHVIIPETEKKVQVYHSLTMDRNHIPGGGYRPIMEILSDEQMRSVLLADAMRDLERFRTKYFNLTELSGLFSVADDLIAQYGGGKPVRKQPVRS